MKYLSPYLWYVVHKYVQVNDIHKKVFQSAARIERYRSAGQRYSRS